MPSGVGVKAEVGGGSGEGTEVGVAAAGRAPAQLADDRTRRDRTISTWIFTGNNSRQLSDHQILLMIQPAESMSW
jgi:hypothetical protein